MNYKAIIGAVAIVLSSLANGAIYNISNVVTADQDDWLFQDSDGSALDGGIVALGYFTGGAPSTDISNISATIAAFSLQASGLTNTFSEGLEGSSAGYVETTVNGAMITAPNAIIGQNMYLFVGNRSTLATSTAWALAVVRSISADSPFEQSYSANPAGLSVYGNIGQFNTFTGDVGQGSGTYDTLQLVAVPEPSAFLLASLGVLALLRRRR